MYKDSTGNIAVFDAERNKSVKLVRGSVLVSYKLLQCFCMETVSCVIDAFECSVSEWAKCFHVFDRVCRYILRCSAGEIRANVTFIAAFTTHIRAHHTYKF